MISWAGRPRAQSRRRERDVGPVLGQVVRPRSNGTTETWRRLQVRAIGPHFQTRQCALALALGTGLLLWCDPWRCHPACSLKTQRIHDLSRATSIFFDPKSSQAPPYRPVEHPKVFLQVGLSSDDRSLYLVPLHQHALQPLCLVLRCLDGSVVPACGCASSARPMRQETCARSFPSKSVRNPCSPRSQFWPASHVPYMLLLGIPHVFPSGY